MHRTLNKPIIVKECESVVTTWIVMRKMVKNKIAITIYMDLHIYICTYASIYTGCLINLFFIYIYIYIYMEQHSHCRLSFDTEEAAEDNQQFECRSIEINILTYFECSLLISCSEVNWIPEIWSKFLIICISISKYTLKCSCQVSDEISRINYTK